MEQRGQNSSSPCKQQDRKLSLNKSLLSVKNKIFTLPHCFKVSGSIFTPLLMDWWVQYWVPTALMDVCPLCTQAISTLIIFTFSIFFLQLSLFETLYLNDLDFSNPIQNQINWVFLHLTIAEFISLCLVDP